MNGVAGKTSNTLVLTQEECQEIAENACGKKVVMEGFKLTQLPAEILGFMGEYFNLELFIKRDNGNDYKLSLFVKSLPVQNGEYREHVKSSGIFMKEVQLYKELFPRLEEFEIFKWHPRCYFVKDDVIVLEDLGRLGYKHILNPKENLKESDIKSALRCFAALHANSINFEAKIGKSIGEMCEVLHRESMLKSDDEWLQANLNIINYIAEVHPGLQQLHFKNFMKQDFLRCIRKVFEILKTSPKYKNVLCHRDAWEKNIFYNSQEGGGNVPLQKCLLIDFQFCSYLPPALDVLFYIHLNTHKTFRDDNLHKWLTFYYSNLARALENAHVDQHLFVTWEEFLESCDYVKLVPLLTSCIYIPTEKSLNRVMEIKQNNPELYNFYMKVDRMNLIKQCLEDDEKFKDILFENVEELVKYLYSVRNKTPY